MQPQPHVGFSKRMMHIFSQERITLGGILEENGKTTFGILLLILALPSALPVPAPGYSTPFGIALAAIGFQIIIGKRIPWMPSKILKKEFSFQKKPKTLAGIQTFTGFFEKFIHPRLSWLHIGPFYRAQGALVALCGLSMIIPLPLTNTPPALGIFLLGIGMTEKDGLFTIVGACIALAGVTLTTLILIFGSAVVRTALETLI